MPFRPGPLAWAIVLGAGLVVVGLLVGILVVLASSRSEIDEQNQRTRLLIQKAEPSLTGAPSVLDRAAPILRDAAPVLRASRAVTSQARRAARESRELLAATRPVVADLAPVVAALGPLVAALTRLVTSLTPAATDLQPVVRALREADLPGLLGDVERLADAGSSTLPALLGLATEIRERELLRRLSRTLPKVGRIVELQRSALEGQRQTLTLTASTHSLLRQSLEVQRLVLARAASIDRKIPGPTATAPALPVP